MMNFGQTIRDRRRQEGLSQAVLAQQAGISRNYLSQIERGKATNLSWQLRQTLTSLLGIQEAELTANSELTTLPTGLAEFAQRVDLPQDDVVMLSRLKYRGKQPNTADKWEMLYNVIKVTIDPQA